MSLPAEIRAPAAAPAGSGPGWLAAEEVRLVDFARGSRVADGFGWLDGRGRVDPDRGVLTYLTARMTHVFALAELRGDPTAADLVAHGLQALGGPLLDEVHGGWFSEAPRPGSDRDKQAYDTAFVLLAASTALTAGHRGAGPLLDRTVAVVEQHFWREADGLSVDRWDRSWTVPEPYRGANANMHLVEAFLAAADATGDPRWLDRALRVAERLIHQVARGWDWRLPEHFDPDWTPRPDYHVDVPDHPFRPYGCTIGHLLEWSRLLVHLHVALPAPPGWLLESARSLFATAVADGWAVDGADGLVYTVSFEGRPVVHERLHWVVAEAIGAATVLAQVTGADTYRDWAGTWWGYAERHLLDPDGGSWHHELDRDNRPSSRTWSGKPDVYHAYQAVLIGQLPLATTLSAAVRGA